MSPINPFGWNENAPPDIDAANLELDRQEIAAYGEEQAVLKSEPGRFQEIIGAAPLTSRGVFTPVRTPILPTAVTLLPKPENSNLATGLNWKLENHFASGSSLADSSDWGLNAATCIKLETEGGGLLASVQRTRETEVNLKGKHLRLWLKLDPNCVGTLKELSFRVGGGAAAFENVFKSQIWVNPASSTQARLEEELGQIACCGEWFPWTVNPCGLPGREGTPNWESIRDFQLRVEDNGTGPSTVRFGGIETVENDMRFPNGVVSFTMDDDYLSQRTIQAAILAKYGYKASVYITGDSIGESGHLTREEVERLVQVYGWDLHVHCMLKANNSTEPSIGMTGLTTQQLIEDWDRIKGLVHEMGGNPNHIAIPSGKVSASLLALARQKFSVMRRTTPYGAETVPPADPYRIRKVGMVVSSAAGPDTTPGTMEWIVKQASETGGWVNFLFHDVAPVAKEPNTIEEKKFKEVIEYINAKGVPVRKVSEVLGV